MDSSPLLVLFSGSVTNFYKTKFNSIILTSGGIPLISFAVADRLQYDAS